MRDLNRADLQTRIMIYKTGIERCEMENVWNLMVMISDLEKHMRLDDYIYL